MYLLSDKRLEKFKNKNANKRAFVLGNGPSLGLYDLSKLENEFVFVTSWFAFHKEYKNLKNVFYCLGAAPIWWGGSLYPILYNSINRNKSAILFTESSLLPLNLKYHYFPNEKIYYITLIDGKRDGSVISGDITNPIELGTNAVQDIILPITFYLGFKDVYLLGCDCTTGTDWKHFHFYDIALMPKEMMNQINACSNGFDSEALEISYSRFKKFFKDNNRNIYDCTKEGNLKVFEKKDYNSLFETSNK